MSHSGHLSELGDHIVGRFDPQRRDDLKPGTEQWIGWEGEWEILWRITDEVGGTYVGDYAVGQPLGLSDEEHRTRPPFPYLWVPLRDLVEVRAVA